MIFFVRNCVIGLVLASCTSTAIAQTTPASEAGATAESEVSLRLEAGIELERRHDWAAAIQHYEEALRTFSGEAKLTRRLLISRLHYDVVRRSGDSAIERMIDTVSVNDALDLYSEVLARLETSYVENVSMQDIVRSGTAYLEVALTEAGFLKAHLPGVSPQVIEEFRQSIHKVTLTRRSNSRMDARRTVMAAAQAAEESIGLRPAATVMQFVFGAVGLLDPYSSFLSSHELNEVESQIEGNFVGLGVALEPHSVPLRILNVIAGGPAREAGLKPGDEILEIDTVVCEEVGAERAADLLRGPENSRVALLVRNSESGTYKTSITRRRVEVPSIEDVKILDSSEGTAYLKITSFQKTTASELDQALWGLHRQGMQSLIIDLRGNPGGWLDASVAAADRFVSSGGIVSTRGKNGIENQNYNATRSGTWQVPLVVLIDDQSASASEIFAGAIRDNNRGELVGQTTYGKGSVQGLFHTRALSSGIRLTVSKFYSPNGQAISRRGVQPTIAVETNEDSTVRLVAKVPTGTGETREPKDKVLDVAMKTARRLRLSRRP